MAKKLNGCIVTSFARLYNSDSSLIVCSCCCCCCCSNFVCICWTARGISLKWNLYGRIYKSVSSTSDSIYFICECIHFQKKLTKTKHKIEKRIDSRKENTRVQSICCDFKTITQFRKEAHAQAHIINVRVCLRVSIYIFVYMMNKIALYFVIVTTKPICIGLGCIFSSSSFWVCIVWLIFVGCCPMVVTWKQVPN